jgi:hypothetical protein
LTIAREGIFILDTKDIKKLRKNIVGRFHPFYRPGRPLGRLKV